MNNRNIWELQEEVYEEIQKMKWIWDGKGILNKTRSSIESKSYNKKRGS